MFHIQTQRRILIFSIVSLLLPNFAGALTMKEVMRGYDDPRPGQVLAATIVNVPTTSDPVANGTAFQTALNNAKCGDIIVLQAGAVYQTKSDPIKSYIGYPFVLPNKDCNGTYITIQSSNLHLLPPEGTRVNASDKINMPRLATGNSYGVIIPAKGASFYKLIGLEVTTMNRNFLVNPGLIDLSYEYETTTSLHNFIFDRMYIHGLEDGTAEYVVSARTGIRIEAHNVQIINSRIAGFRAAEPAFSSSPGASVPTYAILSIGSKGTNDVFVYNNFIEAWFTEMFLGGGKVNSPNQATVSAGATLSQAIFSNVNNLSVGDLIAFQISGNSWEVAKVTGISGNTVTYAPEKGGWGSGANFLKNIPAAGSTVQWNGHMPRRWNFQQNYFYKEPVSMYYIEKNLPSLGLGKGHLEIKSCEDCSLNGNVFGGFAVGFTLTPRNQGSEGPWQNMSNLKITNNLFEKSEAPSDSRSSWGFGIITSDNEQPNVRSENILIENNVGVDFNNRFIQLGSAGGKNVTIRNNTFFNDKGTITWSVLFGWRGDSGEKLEDLHFTDNIFYTHQYSTGCVTTGGCWNTIEHKNNLLIDRRTAELKASNPALSVTYPSDFVAQSVSDVGFEDFTGGNYKLSATSPFKGRGTGGKDPGANIDQVMNYTLGVKAGVPGQNIIPSPTPTPTPIPSVTPTPTPVPTVDVTAPVISSVVSSNLTSSTATISWTTNEGSDSQIEYGLSSSYGASSPINSSLVLSHIVNFSNLSPNTTYYYRVKSRDIAGNLSISSGQSFTTTGASVTPTPTPTPSVTPTPTPTQTTTGEWYNQSWLNKKTLTINKAQVQGTLTNFPVLVSLTDPELKSTSNAGKVASTLGYDFVFTTSNNTKLSHEIEKYDPATGQLIAWVKVPSLSSANDTTLNLYFGNSSATDQQDQVNVWDTNYKAVFHLNSDANDSTSNGNNGTAVNSPSVVTGKVDKAIDFGSVNTNKSISLNNSASMNVGDVFTVNAWVKPTELNNRYGIFSTRSTNLSGSWQVEVGGGGGVFNNASVNTVALSGPNTWIAVGPNNAVSTTTWTHIVAVKNAGIATLFVNGNQVTSQLSTAFTTTNNTATKYIGEGTSRSQYFRGLIDEFRISSTARSADWIKTEYNNQSSPSSFISVSSASAYTPPAAPTLTPTVTPTPTPTNTTPTPTPTPGLPIVTFQPTPVVATTPVTTTPTTQTPGTQPSTTTNYVPLKLINLNGTYYVVSGGQRLGVTNPGMLFSYGLEFKDASIATAADTNLPEGPILSPGDGALVKSPTNPTVYLISLGKKHGFTSEAVFRGLGFSFTKVLTVTAPELDKMPIGEILGDSNKAHLPGTDINVNGTIYYIDSNNKRLGYPTEAVWNSWHFDNDFSNVVPANTADLSLPVGEIVLLRKIE